MNKFNQFEKYNGIRKVLLLFSGGLDTSFLLKYFSTELKCNVITVSFDLGGVVVNKAKLRKRALELGAMEHIEINATEEFLKNYCNLAILANARYNGFHPLSSSLSRPLMAKLSLEIAK